MSKVTRKPAAKRPTRPATELPAQKEVAPSESAASTDAPAASPRPIGLPPTPPSEGGEKYTTPVATRVRPSTEQRVARALDNLPRSWSKQAFHDAALNEFIDRYGLDPQ